MLHKTPISLNWRYSWISQEIRDYWFLLGMFLFYKALLKVWETRMAVKIIFQKLNTFAFNMRLSF